MPTPTFDYRDPPLPLGYYRRKYQLSATTLWRYRKAGLPAICVGSKCFIRESDFCDFLQRMHKKTISVAPLKSGAKGTNERAH